MTTNNRETCVCGEYNGTVHIHARPTLKDRLALVNAGDTLTVVDTRGDVWTGKVRLHTNALSLAYGPSNGARLRFYAGDPGPTVADIRDHVPAVKTTPEPTKIGAVIQDAEGYRRVLRANQLQDGPLRWYPLRGQGHEEYKQLAQPVTVLFEGVDA